MKRAMPRGNRDRNASLKTHKIFVGGLDTDVDEETSEFGDKVSPILTNSV